METFDLFDSVRKLVKPLAEIVIENSVNKNEDKSLA